MKYLQKIGKSLMLPMAVLPVCGILMGIGYLLCPAMMQGGEIVGFLPRLGSFLGKAGGAVIDNMALLFVIGISLGMSDDGHGSACLSGLVSWLVATTMLSPATISVILPKVMENSVSALAFAKIQNPFIGILCGIVGAESYNRFKNMKLPDIFAFFSGRRFVAIVTMLASLAICFVLVLLWPVLFNSLVFAGEKIVAMKGVGAGLYAFLNRLLIPSGLHHALNNVFWFDTIGIGDLTKYWSGSDGAGLGWSLGMYMSGFFPPMMFGIPGAALAMYRCARNKNKARGILFSVAACAFICGVTEPFEFLFIFTAFPLFVAYSVLYGIMTVITYYAGFRAGFAFSAGATDLLFSSSLPAASKTWLVIPLGLLSFVLFYLVFKYMIEKYDFKTPGRENESEDVRPAGLDSAALPSEEKFAVMASGILEAVGGRANVCSVDCCATRLRFELVDNSLVNQTQVKAAGAIGAVSIGRTAEQIVIGVTVQQVCDELKKLLAGEIAPDAKGLQSGSGRVRKTVHHGDRIDIAELFMPQSQVRFSCVVQDKTGLHARPAGELARLVRSLGCDVTVMANGRNALAKSVIELMGLGIECGTQVEVSVRGCQARQAADRLKCFFKERLQGEETHEGI